MLLLFLFLDAPMKTLISSFLFMCFKYIVFCCLQKKWEICDLHILNFFGMRYHLITVSHTSTWIAPVFWWLRTQIIERLEKLYYVHKISEKFSLYQWFIPSNGNTYFLWPCFWEECYTSSMPAPSGSIQVMVISF